MFYKDGTHFFFTFPFFFVVLGKKKADPLELLEVTELPEEESDPETVPPPTEDSTESLEDTRQ